MSDVQAIILAGGLGVRLRPLTYDVPKPMVPVAGKPYLEHQLRLLAEQRITDVVLLTGHLGEQIEDYFGDGASLGLRLRYSREDVPLGTGGALRRAAHLLHEDFVVIYGDSYLPIPYADVAQLLRDQSAEGVLVVYDNAHADSSVRNNVALSPDGRIAVYAKDTAATGLTHVDAGVAALSQSVFDFWEPPEKFSLEHDLYTRLTRRGTLYAYETRQRFYDIGTPERLRTIEEFLAR